MAGVRTPIYNSLFIKHLVAISVFAEQCSNVTLFFRLQICGGEKDKGKLAGTEKRKADDNDQNKDLKKVRIFLDSPILPASLH